MSPSRKFLALLSVVSSLAISQHSAEASLSALPSDSVNGEKALALAALSSLEHVYVIVQGGYRYQIVVESDFKNHDNDVTFVNLSEEGNPDTLASFMPSNFMSMGEVTAAAKSGDGIKLTSSVAGKKLVRIMKFLPDTLELSVK